MNPPGQQNPIRLTVPPPVGPVAENPWDQYVERWNRTRRAFPEWAGPYPGDEPPDPSAVDPERLLKPYRLAAYVGEGVRQALGSALKRMVTSAELIDRAAKKYAGALGMPLRDASMIVRSFAAEPAERLLRPRYAPPTTPKERIAYGIGQAPVQILEFILIDRIVRNPVLSWAITEAYHEIEAGPAGVARGAARGLMAGVAFRQAQRIPGALRRAALTGAAMGAGEILREDPTLTGAAAGAVMGAALGAVPQVTGRQPAKRKMVGVEMPPEDIGVIAFRFGSPTQWAYSRFPLLQQFANLAVSADESRRQAVAVAKSKMEQIIETTVGKRRELWDKVVDYLDDPAYTLQNLPQDAPKIVEAYRQIRQVLEEYRGRIIETFRSMGQEVDPGWGLVGYFPHYHAFRSLFSISVRTDEGLRLIHTGAFAESLPAALAKREEYLALVNPNRIREGLKPLTEEDVIVSWVPKTQLLDKLAAYTNVRWARTLERKMNLPGWQRGPDALMSYIQQAEWFIHMAPLKKIGRDMLMEARKQYGPRAVRRFERYLETFSLPHGRLFAEISARMIERGWDPKILGRTIGTIRIMESMMKLGFTPAAAIANLAQTITNTLPVLGPKWTAEGVKASIEYLTKRKYAGVLERLGVIEMDTKAEAGLALELMRMYMPETFGEKALAALAETSAASMWLFSKAELANRSIASLGSYLRARSMGMADEEALMVARNVLHRTQFNYSRFDSPLILASDTARLALQFKTYMVKQLEFMLGLFRETGVPGRFDPWSKELGRFVATLALATGPIGFPFSETLNELVHLLTGENLLDDIRKQFPVASRGVPGLIGLDLSRRIGYGDWLSIQVSGIPRTGLGAVTTVVRPFVGPAAAETLMLADVMLQPDSVERNVALGRFATQLWPSLVRGVRTYLDQAKEKGVIRDYRGYPIVTDATFGETMLYVMGFNPLRMQRAREEYWRMKEHMEQRSAFTRRILAEYRSAVEAGRQDLAEKALMEALERGIAPRQIIDSYRRTRTPEAMTQAERYWWRYRRTLPREMMPESLRREEPPQGGP